MAQSPILVTGAAGGRRQGLSAQGSTGFHVTRLLLDRGEPVRALVHRLDGRSDELRDLGAEVVVGDLQDLSSVREAADGVARAYFTYPVQAGLLEATANFAVAARDAGVHRVVNLSQLLARDTRGVQPTPHQNRHWLAEQILDWAMVGTVHLNAVVFFENLRAMAGPSLARAGVVALPWGAASTRIPMVGAQDVAGVAVGLLTDAPIPGGTVLPLVGAVVTNQQIAEAFSDIAGRSVPYVELDDERWLQAAAGAGINDVAIEHLAHLWRYLRTADQDYAVTDAIERIGGSAPTSLPEFLDRERDNFALPSAA
jgi:uncharacterized protein YbjT (DUF2867 family)